MASPEPNQPTIGKWTFVNSKGEEEDVDDGLSTTSSSSSSEFVKLDGQEVAYHHKSKENNAYDTDISSFSDDEKPADPCSIVVQPVVRDGCGDAGDVQPREEGPASDISDASLQEDSVSVTPLTTDTIAAVSSEDESDVEILPRNQPVEDITVDSVPEGLVREDNMIGDQVQGTPVVGASVPLSGNQSPAMDSSGNSEQGSFLSRQTSEDSSVQFRLVLMPRSLSVTDSDSDFSHLDSHSSLDHSESEDLSDHGDNVKASSVDPGFCFVKQNDRDHDSDGFHDHHEDDHAGHVVRHMGNPDVENNPERPHGPEEQLNPVVGNLLEAQQIPDPAHDEVDKENADAVIANVEDILDVIDNVAVINHDNVDDESDHDEADRESDHDDVDTGTESGVEDDRIESDQSDGIPADEDDDLSFSNIGLENISLHEVNHTRQYVHQPNKYLSGTLSLVVIMAGWMALGLGIGHSLGSSKETVYLNHHPVCFHAQPLRQDNLSQCLRHKRDALQILSRERFDRDSDEAESIIALARKDKTIKDLTRQIKYWKIQVNELYRINGDLMTEVGRLKYQEHPGNTRGELSSAVNVPTVDRTDVSGDLGVIESLPRADLHAPMDATDDKTASHVVENDIPDISAITEELPAPEASEEWENQTKKLKQELTLAQGRAAMWQELYLSERHRKQPVLNTTPDVLSCLSLFTPKVNFTEIVQALNNSIVRSFMEFPNISQIRSYIDHSLESEKIFSTVSEFQALFEELSKLWSKWSYQQGDSSAKAEWDFENGNTKDRYESEQEHSEEQQSTWSRNLKQLLNETQESVSRVSREIQEKWKHVKNISEDLWKKHQPTINNWQVNLSQQISDIGSKIKEKLQRKSSCWFGRKKARHEKWRKHHSFSERKDSPPKQHQKPDNIKHGKSDEHSKKSGMDRNQRKAFKKALKKLIKGVKRLNSKTFLRLGHEGNIRMVTQFQYFKDAYRGRFPDATSEQWVSCQVKWWEAQLGSKRFDLHKCASNLFRWQSRLEKKQKKWQTEEKGWECGHKRDNEKRRTRKWECKKDGRNEEDQNHKHKRKREERHSNKWEHKKQIWQKQEKHWSKKGKARDIHNSGAFAGTKRREYHSHGPDKHEAYKKDAKENNIWKAAKKHNFTDDGGVTVSGEWFFKPRQNREIYDEDSWYIQKMKAKKHRNSESGNKDGRWVFERADDRDFHRKRPNNWYYRRVEGRRKDDYREKRRYPSYHRDDLEDEHNEYYNSYGFSVCF